MRKKGGFTDRVRQAIIAAGPGGISAKDLAMLNEIDTVVTRPVHTAAADLIRAGEVERIGRGVYRWAGKKRDKKPEIRQVMWSVLRARRTASVEDMQELAGASEQYAREFLNALVRQGVCRRIKNKQWHLVADPIELPDDKAKAEKLRRIREKKAVAVSALDRAFKEIATARMALADFSVGVEGDDD